MPMTVEASRWWSTRRFSIVSMMLSFAYAIIMGWAYFSVQMAKTPPTPHIVNQIDTAWLTGGLLGGCGSPAAGDTAGVDAARHRSIHARVRRATLFECQRPRLEFQSTPPHGGDAMTRGDVPLSFNPRPRTAGDTNRPQTLSGFQSTPPRGGRQPRGECTTQPTRFQSTPPRGGRRPFRCHDRCNSHRFQSTPPRGGRPASLGSDLGGMMFQSTPPRGGRRRRMAFHGFTFQVSIHAPARGATPAFTVRQRVG